MAQYQMVTTTGDYDERRPAYSDTIVTVSEAAATKKKVVLIPKVILSDLKDVPRRISRALRSLSEVSDGEIEAARAERGQWDNPIEFFLSCLGYAVGLGNVWRFPFQCHMYGGGAFFIPYFIMLFGCAMPILFAELIIGQYSAYGPLSVWALSPAFKGLGIAMVVVSCVCSIYYNMITGWAMYYLYASMTKVLPWACCEKPWASDACFASNDTCPSPLQSVPLTNTTRYPAADYFDRHVLNIADSECCATICEPKQYSAFSDIGLPSLHLVIVLLIAWICVFLVLARGIKSIGKIVYFTSTFPYVILVALLIVAMGKEGAIDGIIYYLKPDLTRLYQNKAGDWDFSVWSAAASQIFFSTGVGMGSTIALASYNRFHNNIYRDTVVVALGNSATSVFAGFVVFSILGVMAKERGVLVENVVQGGPGLAFVAYPQAVLFFSGSSIWSIAFFFMLITLALSSMFPMVEAITSVIIDQFAQSLRRYKFWITLLTCTLFFILGLPLTTNVGTYILDVMDTNGVTYPLLFIGFAEIMVLSWRYGAERMHENVETMSKSTVSRAWIYVWKYVTPSLLIVPIGFALNGLRTNVAYKYNDGSAMPVAVTIIAWCLTALTLLPIFIYFVYAVVRYYRNCKQTNRPSLWRALCDVTAVDQRLWRPAVTAGDQ